MTIFEGRNQIAYSYGRFGYTRNSGKTWHGGIDVVGVDSSMIRAVVAGIVVFSGIVTNKTDRTWEWGYYVCIQGNDGRFYYYCHMSLSAMVRTATWSPGVMGPIESTLSVTVQPSCRDVARFCSIFTSPVLAGPILMMHASLERGLMLTGPYVPTRFSQPQ